ncbi:MAG TPA: hypothetical protein VF627_08825, partial [Abditibacterium sp.]
MKKLFFPALLMTLCLGGVARADFKTLAEQEAYWLKDYRDKPGAESLVRLADIRENRGKFAEALQTWNLLRNTFGNSYSRAFRDEKMLTYAQLADWTVKRIAAKRRARTASASASKQRQAERDFQTIQKNGDWPKDVVSVDLNGDGIKEVVR